MQIRFVLSLYFLFFWAVLLKSQQNAREYYTLSGKMESKDTTGLYARIFRPGTDPFYGSLAKGDYFQYQGQIQEAFDNYKDALDEVHDKAKDTLYALANYKIGALYYFGNNYPEALRYFNRASLIYNYKPENYQQARLYIYVGTIHIDLASNALSIKCFEAALAFYRAQHDEKRIASTQNNIGIVYTSKMDFPNAKKYLDSSLAIRERLNDFHGKGQSYNNIGTLYFAMEQYAKALEYYKLGYQNRITAKAPSGGLMESQVNIGKTYFKLNDKENAKDWLEQGLEEGKRERNYELQKRASEQLKDLYYQMGDFRKAYEMQELFFVINDSLYGLDKKNLVAGLVLQNQFESKIRQDSILNVERIRSEQVVAEEKEKRNTILFLVLLSGIFFLLIFVFQLYKSNVHKKKTNAIILAQRDSLDQKQREIIDSINYAKRIQESLLPSIRYIERNIERLKGKGKD